MVQFKVDNSNELQGYRFFFFELRKILDFIDKALLNFIGISPELKTRTMPTDTENWRELGVDFKL